MFYNPAMAEDRDLGVAVLRAWREGRTPCRTGLDLLAATGVRGLRLVHEAGPFDRFDLDDGHPAARAVLARNVERYAAEGARLRARPPSDGAVYDYVDLDPYGTPVRFLDVAIASVAPGGLLATTATDTRVLAGVDRGVAERRYGGVPVRGRLGPEGGLRLLIAEVARRAYAVGRELHPVLAYVGDHHVRVYATLPASSDASASMPLGRIDAGSWTGPPLGSVGSWGPFWLGPLFDPTVVGQLRNPPDAAAPGELARQIALLQEEAHLDRPFFYEANTLARRLKLSEPPATESLRGALRSRGFELARSHVRPGAFRTDAPDEVVADAARAAAQSQNDRVRA